ncbi:MAG: response regulator, partial [Cytophagia bacterium]|nr:response regulator [Cytophagia bacterium]
MKQKAKILILDDDNYVLLSLRILLEQHYTDVRGINNPSQLESTLEENEFDIVVLDMNFTAGDTSGKDGLRYLQQIKKANP